MNCYPQFVRPLSNLVEVRHTRSACLCVAVLWVSYTLAQGRPYFCYWLTWNYVSSCTVTLNDNLVQSVFCLMGTPCRVWRAFSYSVYKHKLNEIWGSNRVCHDSILQRCYAVCCGYQIPRRLHLHELRSVIKPATRRQIATCSTQTECVSG